MKQVIFFIALCACAGANAAGLACSIHPSKGISDAALPALAKITKADAERAALEAVHISAASVASGELEAESGCLIYSFDINIPGKKYIVEVAVDAGNGKVLSKKRESVKQQAAEAAADRAAAKKQ